jgi:hypothetical protein
MLRKIGALKVGLNEDNYADCAFGKLDKADLRMCTVAILGCTRFAKPLTFMVPCIINVFL